MNIQFDIFSIIPEMAQEMNLEDKAIFDEIVGLFERRLEPLRKEMEEQELTDNPPCCIMIHFLPPQEQWALPKEQQDQKIRVSANGYNADLKNKIDLCFVDKDFTELNNRLEQIAAGFRN